MSQQPGRFLTAEWRHLAMLNFEIDCDVLQPWIPNGTELDLFQGRALVSMVGFRFLNTKLLGIAIPFHRNFDEVNLRFYVRRRVEEGWRRGVVFIKEIVPKRMVALIAQRVYNENYVRLPMKSQIEVPGAVRYSWYFRKHENWIAGRTLGEAYFPSNDQEEYFIQEHYWGYSRQPDASTNEYAVEHESWKIRKLMEPEFVCDVESIYGKAFVKALSNPPRSAFLAEGSHIIVRSGRRLTKTENVLDVK